MTCLRKERRERKVTVLGGRNFMLGDKNDLFAKNLKKAFMRDESEDCFFFFSSTKPKLFFELLRQNIISPPLLKGKQTTTIISQ